MKLKLLSLVLALQTAWILYTVATQEHALAAGRTVLLETEPVDPRDMLEGNYLMLNYKISSVPRNLFSPPVKANLPTDEKVYVALALRGQFYEIARASTNEFEPGADERLLTGKVTYHWWSSTGNPSTNPIHVDYGIEKYFISEGTGHPAGKLTVQAVVPDSGHPKIKQVFINGKPYSEVMKPDQN